MLSHTFDLKGSQINREVLNPIDRSISQESFKEICLRHCLKDNDLNFITKVRHPNLINILYRDFIFLMEIIKRDTLLLQQNNIMDYSLFIAIEDKMYN